MKAGSAPAPSPERAAGPALSERGEILPEPDLPGSAALLDAGRAMARDVTVGRCPFLDAHDVPCEIAFKEQRMAAGVVTRHAQVGYRDPDKTRRAFAEIHERLDHAGYGVDRYGICLDWSMGYPAAARAGLVRGTGLILDEPEDFARLTAMAPVAPHFGDFVLGTPAAVENTAAALAAGATAIGNLGQYFTYRMPHPAGDAGITAATVTALGLMAAQPVDILVHSNLDDGFAALFCDLACSLGAVLIEQYIVEDLVGGRIGHCYGHTFSDPLTRLAFVRALARVSRGPGTMIYGNTVSYTESGAESGAALAAYLQIDILGQAALPTGHAVNPVPVTEALRIPEIDEIVDAHLFAGRLEERTTGFADLLDPAAADRVADDLVAGGTLFRDRVLDGLEAAGIDIRCPFELLLALRRVGARRLEALYGPGALAAAEPRGRAPLVRATVIAGLQAEAAARREAMDPADREAIARAGLTGCVATTDVHEYGKILVDSVLGPLGIRLVEGGIAASPDELARAARDCGADFIALSTYNGIALDFLADLQREMTTLGLDLPVFIGGRLNRVPDASNTSLPVDVSADLGRAGAIVCPTVDDMLARLAAMARQRTGAVAG